MKNYRGCTHCLHYRVDGTCVAFDPNDIPLAIVSGELIHDKPISGQENFTVYEPSSQTLGEKLKNYMEITKLIRTRVEIAEGDIGQQKVEAIVNAANESLMAGGGVSGAIHKSAGLGLEEECLRLGGCEEGQAKITNGYNLFAKWIIHTVGPVWENGSYSEDKVLAQCYRNCFLLVEKYKIKSVAFPAISTGAYGFPMGKAAKIAIRETRRFLEENTFVEKVVFVCYEEEAYNLYNQVVSEVLRTYPVSQD